MKQSKNNGMNAGGGDHDKSPKRDIREGKPFAFWSVHGIEKRRGVTGS